MTTMTANPTMAVGRSSRAAQHVTFPHVVTSEWIKFRSVRSTAWTLPITAVLMVGLAVLQAWGTTQLEPAELFTTSAASIVTGGWFLAQLAVSVLGILAITGEYGTGMIRSTFAAVPRRLPALWAKALILAVTVAVVSLVAVALSYVAALPFLDQLGLELDLGSAGDLRLLLGAPLYLATIAVFAFAIGSLVRHSAGSLAIVLGLLLVVENVFAAIPLRFFEVVAPFLPMGAGSRLLYDDATLEMLDAAATGATLTPWQGYGVLVAWVVVLLTAGAVLLRRRDA
ncbi:ABC transporter permease [Cellulomonas sp. KRMCY2]|uniref:ABC transporter permease n=1 Tax=Cellulomonas sp. KRMCY2 TaxID=1304865 RepID=UPI00045E8374|nr:ABC transporter permease [Cellulomonas sp. KRMCY2]